MTPGEAQLLTLAAAQFVVALAALVSSFRNNGRIKSVEKNTDGMVQRLEKAAHAAGVQSEQQHPQAKK